MTGAALGAQPTWRLRRPSSAWARSSTTRASARRAPSGLDLTLPGPAQSNSAGLTGPGRAGVHQRRVWQHVRAERGRVAAQPDRHLDVRHPGHRRVVNVKCGPAAWCLHARQLLRGTCAFRGGAGSAEPRAPSGGAAVSQHGMSRPGPHRSVWACWAGMLFFIVRLGRDYLDKYLAVDSMCIVLWPHYCAPGHALRRARGRASGTAGSSLRTPGGRQARRAAA